MALSRRSLSICVVTSIFIVTLLFYSALLKQSLQRAPGTSHLVGGEDGPDSDDQLMPLILTTTGDQDALPTFSTGGLKAPGSNYSRVLVIPRTMEEDVSWLSSQLPDTPTAIYTADNSSASLHPPKNKGHEVMIYLTYLITHYDTLPDLVIFIHAHRWSWHNNDLHDNDMAQMLRALSNERVVREGYMNLRCHWGPGCPAWMHPLSHAQEIGKQEQAMLGASWSELFPETPVPEVLAQPCCAQFAVSRERIRGIPLSRFVFYRDWLLRTPLDDYISGRIFEYTWQFVFTGREVVCPLESVCYCDGYGLCFGDEDAFQSYMGLQEERLRYQKEVKGISANETLIKDALEAGNAELAEQVQEAPEGRKEDLDIKIQALEKEMGARKAAAKNRGRDGRFRAAEAGRPWKVGDGY
ncbi:MAG: hypothetical protein M1824_004077 [Vezdaea acicularis]|nr:MAG: hypothetical protein M1824_004077 [Vezdaea acicularis]